MIDGIYILTAAAALLALLGVYLYVDWSEWNDQRKLERRVHVNLQRMSRR